MGTKQNPNQAVPNRKRNRTTHEWPHKNGDKQNPNQAVPDKETELHMSGPQNPSQAVQDKDTELHMTDWPHKNGGQTKSKPGSAK